MNPEGWKRLRLRPWPVVSVSGGGIVEANMTRVSRKLARTNQKNIGKRWPRGPVLEGQPQLLPPEEVTPALLLPLPPGIVSLTCFRDASFSSCSMFCRVRAIPFCTKALNGSPAAQEGESHFQ